MSVNTLLTKIVRILLLFRWTNACEGIKHDTNRNTPDFPYVGQNAAMGATTAGYTRAEVEQRIDNWYEEVSAYLPKRFSHF